jgi:hypothetical protein
MDAAPSSFRAGASSRGAAADSGAGRKFLGAEDLGLVPGADAVRFGGADDSGDLGSGADGARCVCEPRRPRLPPHKSSTMYSTCVRVHPCGCWPVRVSSTWAVRV